MNVELKKSVIGLEYSQTTNDGLGLLELRLELETCCKVHSQATFCREKPLTRTARVETWYVWATEHFPSYRSNLAPRFANCDPYTFSLRKLFPLAATPLQYSRAQPY